MTLFFDKVKSFFKRFSVLLSVLLAVVICMGTLAISLIYVRSMTSSLWNQIVTDITEVTAQGGHAFETFVNKEVESIRILAENMKNYEFAEDKQMDSALELFDMYSVESGYFTLVVYDSPAGNEDNCTVYLALTAEERQALAQSGEKRTGETKAVSLFPEFGRSGISDVYYNMYTGQKTIAYYTSFTFANGVKAIVRKGQILSDINEEFSLSFYDNTGFSYITKNDGAIVIRSDHPKSNRTSKNIFSFLDTTENGSDEMVRLKDAMADGRGGAMLSTESGDDRVISFIPLKNTDNWYIVSIIPDSAVSRNVEEVLQSSLSITVIIVAVIIILVLFTLASYLFRRNMLKQAAEVKYREQLFTILANNTDDVFVMLSHREDKAEYISPNVERVLGVKEADAKKDIHVIGNPDNDENYGGLEAVHELGTGETLVFDSARTHKQTGETRYFREAVYRASINGVDKDIIVFSDRTVEKQAEVALTEAMEAAKAASTAKSAFLSSMSHDIRTPMNAIVGMTSIALKHIDDKERVKDCLNKITMSSNHLLTLINDVLDISKIESGKLNLSPLVFSLRDTVTNLVNIVRPQVTEKQLEFEVHVNGVVYEHLYADMLRVNQIFINILSNAIKYTPKGGKVIMELKQDVLEPDKLVRLTYIVKDTGIGMSPEYMKTMYDTFSRAENSRTNTIQGTGLGLAIVKQMVDLMHGTIDCESEEDLGTTFTIKLDLPVGKKDTAPQKLPPVKILVVDDDEVFLEGVKDVITDLGATVEGALSGKEALELVKNNGSDYGVVIVDWKMPGMSGLETIERIKKLLKKNTPIILVSAYDWEDIEGEARGLGVDGFVSKPLFRSYIFENLCKALKLNGSEKSDESETVNDLNGIKLLIAEDNDLNWEVISTLLDMYGIKCSRALNGQDCVNIIEASKKGDFDLILMDVQMPVMNGKDATREIRKSKKSYVKDIPIIAMTADAFAEDITACLEAGMNGHLSKPVDMDKLCQEIKLQLSKK